MRKYIPFALILGFLTLTWGFLALNQSPDTRGKEFATEALNVLAVCENAIMRGQLPDLSDWKPVRPLSGDIRSAEYLSPRDAEWVAVRVKDEKWGDGRQLSCNVETAWSEHLFTRADVAAVVLAFMEARAARFGGAPHKPFDIHPFALGDVMYGVQTRDLVNDSCPLLTMMSVFDEPYRIGFSVSDRFTWCSH